MKKMYLMFGLMLLTSFIEMYAVMFLNVAQWDHVMLSWTRTYMSLLMVAPMGVIMLLYMWSMYKNRMANFAILAVCIVVFTVTLVLLRQQIPVGDVNWLKAMIPHHSSAILVSQRAHIEDEEARLLAHEIIEAQKREIAQMKKILYRLEEGSSPTE
jgi:uncharacterized protein (DUF305 family)